MPEKLKTTDVLNKDSVNDVHQETSLERLIRIFPLENAAAILFVAAACAISIYVIVSDKPSLSDYKTSAWSVISGVAGAALNHLFGNRRSTRR